MIYELFGCEGFLSLFGLCGCVCVHTPSDGVLERKENKPGRQHHVFRLTPMVSSDSNRSNVNTFVRSRLMSVRFQFRLISSTTCREQFHCNLRILHKYL